MSCCDIERGDLVLSMSNKFDFQILLCYDPLRHKSKQKTSIQHKTTVYRSSRTSYRAAGSGASTIDIPFQYYGVGFESLS